MYWEQYMNMLQKIFKFSRMILDKIRNSETIMFFLASSLIVIALMLRNILVQHGV